jgi:hypothetical protein
LLGVNFDGGFRFFLIAAPALADDELVPQDKRARVPDIYAAPRRDGEGGPMGIGFLFGRTSERRRGASFAVT